MNDLITEEAKVGCSVLQFPCSGVDSNHQGPPNASDALLTGCEGRVRAVDGISQALWSGGDPFPIPGLSHLSAAFAAKEFIFDVTTFVLQPYRRPVSLSLSSELLSYFPLFVFTNLITSFALNGSDKDAARDLNFVFGCFLC